MLNTKIHNRDQIAKFLQEPWRDLEREKFLVEGTNQEERKKLAIEWDWLGANQPKDNKANTERKRERDCEEV